MKSLKALKILVRLDHPYKIPQYSLQTLSHKAVGFQTNLKDFQEAELPPEGPLTSSTRLIK